MDYAALVGMLHGGGHRDHKLRRLSGAERSAVELLCQAAAADVFKRQEGAAVLLADFVDLHDVGMSELSDGLGFGAEAGEVFRAGARAGENHLERDQAV